MARKASKILSPAEKKEQIAVARNSVRGLREDLKACNAAIREAKAKGKATAAVLRTAEREKGKAAKAVDKAVAGVSNLTAK